MRPPGVVLYQGPSVLDGEPIVMVATFESENGKTGNMIQTWIIRADMHPLSALSSGADKSICGNCRHRPANENSCYVVVAQSVTALYRAFKAGSYPPYKVTEHARFFVGREIRLGAYGDPAAVPKDYIRQVLWLVDARTGYTHQWRSKKAQWLKGVVQASVDSEAEAQLAKSRGWRYFRVKDEADPRLPGEGSCPASSEYMGRTGKKVQCRTCTLCDGSSASVVINGHGVRWGSRRVSLKVV